MTPQKAIKEAIKRAGGTTALAKAIGTSKQNIHIWDVAPPHWCLSIEKATGVSRYNLRPDIYGREMPTPNQRIE